MGLHHVLGCVQNASTNQSKRIIFSTNKVLARERRRISGCHLSLLFSAKTRDSRKYVCVCRLIKCKTTRTVTVRVM